MRRLRVAFLDASHNDPTTRRNFRRELDADLVEFDASGGQLPDHYDFDAVVVSGSSSSVYWDDEWIADLVDWVAEAADRDLPILGVCFGHQIVAAALGGTVEGMGSFELGYTEVEHTGDDPLFEGVGDRFTVFTSHGDSVTDLPPGAHPIAENEYGNHGFRKGHCFGVQFHPEYDTATAEKITESKGEFLGDDRIQSVLDGITPANYEAACEAKQLFDNFVQYAQRVRDESKAAA
ncbi:GMP synthase (glutamine-hydrolysing) [Halogranum amylolyticum]|uniref:GMP synthase (Glutamine-hydrolysing) n=1 Tax=Halogranum amylolyticum TaxID=660520 RepID=A0A1H8QMI1_9EURY|nr:gamma-glutamyl-gamma-aminobutyrate hydrolase family protein [Halogranum amylolyticum]SEO55455.1 GMP synthase (glutamine-hydrolysing) [Halogranum amylolyticum]